MKKILSVLLAVVLLLTSTVFVFANDYNVIENRMTTVKEDDIKIVENYKDQEIREILENINDLEVKTKIQMFIYTPAYIETELVNDEMESFKDIDAEFKEATSIVLRLSKLSASEVDLEISKLVLECIKQNSDNMNIEWSKLFIEDYVAKYTPNYVEKLTAHNVLAREIEESNIPTESKKAAPTT